MNILMTYGWVRSTYAALRNLTNHDLRVFVADHHRFGMCQFSRYKHGFFKTPNPFSEPDRYIALIGKIIHEADIQMVFPSHDETELLALRRNDLPGDVLLPVASYELLAKCNNKAFIQNYAQSVRISIPRLYEWKNVDELGSVLTAVEAKDRYVIRLRRSNSAKGVFYADTPDEVVSRVRNLINLYNLQPDRYPIVQQCVQGEGWGVSCLYWEGQLVASFTHRRLREKMESGGPSTYREHLSNPAIESMAHKLLSSLGWHGLAMVEFKYNPETGQAWLIEVNPRLWGSVHHAISAGVEFPYLLFLASTQGPQAAIQYHAQQKIRYPWRSRWYLGDCILAVEKMISGKWMDACKVLIPGQTHAYDDVNLSDPGAFVGELCHYLQQLILRRRLNPAEEGMLG